MDMRGSPPSDRQELEHTEVEEEGTVQLVESHEPTEVIDQDREEVGREEQGRRETGRLTTAESPGQTVVTRTASNIDETGSDSSIICNDCKMQKPRMRVNGKYVWTNGCQDCWDRDGVKRRKRTTARDRMTALVATMSVEDLDILVDCLDSRFQGDFAYWSDTLSSERKSAIMSISSSFVNMVSGGDTALLQEMVSGQHKESSADDDVQAMLQEMVSGQHKESSADDDAQAMIEVDEIRGEGEPRVTVDPSLTRRRIALVDRDREADSESSSERDGDVADRRSRVTEGCAYPECTHID